MNIYTGLSGVDVAPWSHSSNDGPAAYPRFLRLSETLSDALKVSMGEAWRDRETCHEYVADRENESGESAAGT